MKSATYSKIIVGKVYPTKLNGDLKVIKHLKGAYFLIEFIDTGFQKTVRADGIRGGIAKDWSRPSRFGVGFLGLGCYATTLNGKANQCSVIWKSMLERCYCPNFQKKSPTYKGCTVVEEWHNYQVFAKWFYENYPKDGEEYQLDKDCKFKGNKVYSPETCTFLTPYDNKRVAHEKVYKFVDPLGNTVDVVNLTEFCRNIDLTRENMGKVHRGERPRHKGWTKYIE